MAKRYLRRLFWTVLACIGIEFIAFGLPWLAERIVSRETREDEKARTSPFNEAPPAVKSSPGGLPE